MITADSLTKQFTTDKGQVVEALRSVSFKVDAGEFYVLLGPSGSGKTTTLRSVAGIETVDNGVIQIAGNTVFSSGQSINIPPEQRPVAMVFQSYALWPHMDVYNNIVFPLRKGVRRVSAAEAQRRVTAVTETLQLTPYLKRPISQLSGGQQQRVALARALALEPAVLLMDEPLSNLDAKLRAQLRVEIKNLTSSLGITTLYVTHDQIEAMVMGDRIAVMENGDIAGEGSPDQLYRKPSNEFVAKFLGEMNFITGKLGSHSGNGTIAATELGDVNLDKLRDVSLFKSADRAQPSSIKLGFRPEDVHVGGTRGDIVFEAIIESSHYVGDAVLCDMRIGTALISARLPNTIGFKKGDKSMFSVETSKMSVFPV